MSTLIVTLSFFSLKLRPVTTFTILPIIGISDSVAANAVLVLTPAIKRITIAAAVDATVMIIRLFVCFLPADILTASFTLLLSVDGMTILL